MLFQFDGKGIAADPEIAKLLKKIDAGEAKPPENPSDFDLAGSNYWKDESAETVKIRFK